MNKEQELKFVDRQLTDNTVAIILVYKYDGGEFRSVLSDGSGKYYLDAEYMTSNDTVFKYLDKHSWSTLRESVPDGLKGDELWSHLAGKCKDAHA